MSSQVSSEGSSELRSEEDSSLGGSFMKIASCWGSLLLAQSSKIPGDVFADTLNFSEFGGASWRGLSVSEGSKFVPKLVDIGSDGLHVGVSDLLVNFLFHHSQI